MANKDDPAIGKAKTAVVTQATGEAVAIITEIFAQTTPVDSKTRLEFRGPVKLDDKAFNHVEAVILPIVDQITQSLELPIQNFLISISNIGATATAGKGIKISGFSADLPMFLAMLSASLQAGLRQDIPYDSAQAIELGETVMKHIQDEGHKASQALAAERGAFPNFDGSIYAEKGQQALRNATVGGHKEFDRLPMTSDLRQALLQWREERLKQPTENKEHVFVCLAETPFCEEYYGKPFLHRQHLMERLCIKAKVKPFGFHGIRHLTASILYQKGYTLSVIQTILRHASPNTTARYIHSLGLEETRGALEEGLKGPAQVIEFPKVANG
jgi:hypothetical protein